MKTIEITDALHTSLEKLAGNGETVVDVIDKIVHLDNIHDIMMGAQDTQVECVPPPIDTINYSALLSENDTGVWGASKSTSVILRMAGKDRHEVLYVESTAIPDTYGFCGTDAKWTTGARLFINNIDATIELHCKAEVVTYDQPENRNNDAWLLDIIRTMKYRLGWRHSYYIG